jgi:regulatory protein
MIEPFSTIQARSRAIDYLSRREHSSLELRNKLIVKGFDPTIIDDLLIQLRKDNLLSDERFVECYVRSRINKGFGPLHIQQELHKRGIEGELSTNELKTDDAAWIKCAHLARQKRFGQSLPQSEHELIKQTRFLSGRGFTYSQIQAVLSDKE